MSHSAAIITSNTISFDELRDFITSIGGLPVPDRSVGSFVVNDGDTDVWVSIQPNAFTDEFYDEEMKQEWRKVLSGEPASVIELELDHGSKNMQLYLFLAYNFGKRWNCALDDIDDSVLSFDEIENKYINNKELLTIDK
jgi:hypothetical protein